jgi:predicted RNA-binding protein with PUA-like domain
MRYWLMKTEPSVFSFEDLVKAPKKTSSWEGVRNYQARNLMRDEFKKGDKVLIYHSNAEEPGVYGLAEVVREGYPDHLALDPKSRFYDEKTKGKNESPWIMVDVKATQRLAEPVTRDRMREEPRLKNIMVLKKGARLSVQPVTATEYETLLELGKPKKL